MNLTADLIPMRVVVPGGAVVVANTYYGDGSTTWVKGDLCRVNTSGRVVNSATDSDTTYPIKGMLLETWATAPTTSQFVKILQFASDTVLETQVYAAAAADAQPQDVTVGVSYTLRDGGSGKWSITTTTTKGIATVVAKPGDAKWFDDYSGVQADDQYGLVHIRFTAAQIDGFSA